MRSGLLPANILAVSAFAALLATPSPKLAEADEIAYSNTLGTQTFAYGAGVAVADDLILTGSDGCQLARFEFDVSGSANGKGVGPFVVDFELFDDCPGAGGVPIPGTQGHVSIGNAGTHTLSLQIPANVSISLPRIVWLSVTFDRDHAGWVGGAPALVGYSDDWFYNPLIGCTFSHGGYPGSPHASMNARLYVRGNCPATHTAYRASTPRRGPFNPGIGVRFGDDLHLDGACQLIAYEATVRGSGLYELDLRLPGANGFPGKTIDGTAAELQHFGFEHTFRIELETPVQLPAKIWFTASLSSSVSRVMVAGLPARIGHSDPGYAKLAGPAWQMQSFPPELGNGALEVTLLCTGSAPLGACCDMHFLDPQGNAVCREVSKANCPYPAPGSPLLPAWREGAVCSPDPFDPPCGTAACCLANGTCGNLTQQECAPRGSSWTLGAYCDSPDLDCSNLCLLSDEACTVPHPTRGCIDPYCCAEVCSQTVGAFCCQNHWDTTCVTLAALHCGIPPANDECFSQSNQQGARLVTVGTTTDADLINATQSESDPGFCCHGEEAGGRGLATVWFRFLATGTSARVRTCTSNAPATDSLLQVFAPADLSSPENACATLRSIGCSDDVGCPGGGQNSAVCLRNLTVGQTYYVMVAAKTEETRGIYRLQIQSSCGDPASPGCDCPSGIVEWIDPPTHTVDARRPHAPSNAGQLEGLNQFVVHAPLGSDHRQCWQLCETTVPAQPNQLQNVTPLGGNRYRLELQRPITAGAATTMILGGDPATRGVFYAHPGNINSDASTGPSDILELIDSLNGVRILTWGQRSGDVDRSGVISPGDILTTIDLLNGANTFAVWNGVPRPNPAPCTD